MKKNHNFYLDLAYQLAEKNLGKTGLNPSVGAVVVKNDSVISSGSTSLNGRPHAEFNALNKTNNCSGAKLYTTLEPCVHYGKTSPCTNIIIKKKIKKVYFGCFDPDIRSFKKAKLVLKKSGIDAKQIESKNYKNFYKSYFINKKFRTPFISAKLAISNDFFSITKKEKWITNKFSRKIVHILRSKYDCIISTSKTINLDNSLLNCRIDGLNKFKPDLFIVDLNLKLKKNLLLNKILKKRKTYLITDKINYKKANIYKKKGFKIILINSLKTKKDFYSLYNTIFKLGYTRVFLETGLTFLKTTIKNKLINNLYLFKSKNNLGKYGKNNVSAFFIKKIKFKEIPVNLNNDKLLIKEF
jgi:diaminohydroxyphosphoribosylaminopyrimidine deaminase/5-amino-6-(5-phosphoribosylamino)uracil reductase